jgi:hypothetical protein
MKVGSKNGIAESAFNSAFCGLFACPAIREALMKFTHQVMFCIGIRFTDYSDTET